MGTIRPLKLRSPLLAAIAINLTLIGVRTASYRPLQTMEGASSFVIEAVASLLTAGVLVVVVGSLADSRTVLKPASVAGLGGGSLLVIHMALEQFGDHVGEDSLMTLAFMVAAFTTWAGAAYLVARWSFQIIPGVLAGCWSAMTSVVVVVTFGLALTFFDVPRASYVATWPEFKASGWADPQAFSIANSFENASTHIVVALVVGFVMASGGSLLAWMTSPRSRAAP